MLSKTKIDFFLHVNTALLAALSSVFFLSCVVISDNNRFRDDLHDSLSIEPAKPEWAALAVSHVK